MSKVFGISSASAFRRINQLELQAIEIGIGDKQANSTPTKVTHLWRPHREGCEQCKHTGYNGRVALVEVLPINEQIQHTILSPETTTTSLQTTANKHGFIPMALDGIIKALRGVVTIKDVLYVVDRSMR